jgi:hypothetical protein
MFTAASTDIESVFQHAKDAGFKARACSEYMRIHGWIKNRINLDEASILDFGSDQGVTAAAFALRHPKARVIGYDIKPMPRQTLAKIYQTQINCALPDNLGLACADDGPVPAGPFDLIFAWSVFEHIPETSLIDTFQAIRARLKPNGLFFLFSEPLYYSPRGSHLYRYSSVPWHHLLGSIDEVRDQVLSAKVTATELREWQQFLDLNRISANGLRHHAITAGFTVLQERLSKTDLIPPEQLTSVYHLNILQTTSIQLLLQ